ncbi:MAG: SpoIIE family protein phosphatase [Syntrophobacteria bacterium]
MTNQVTTFADDQEQPERILLVDDNPTNLQVLFQTLEGRGYNLLVAKDGETAISIAIKALPELILLDIMMPGIDGYEVCRRLKNDPTTKEIPIIFLSALGETKDKVRGLDLGAVDYISKPFQAEEVIARVNTHITIYRLRREVQAQKDALERELEVVAKVQYDLLPKRLPEIKGMKLSAYYKTSRYAGGDYYDIIELPDERWGFMVADAEGHSTPAAVRMAMTCALLRGYPGAASDPDEVLKDLNKTLCKVVGMSFITAIFAIYDGRDNSLRIVKAGHMDPLLYRPSKGETVEIPCEGTYAMGIEQYDEVPVTEIRLQSGDRLLFYTDGFSERFNPEGEMYGLERLSQQLSKDHGGNPKEILDTIVDDAERFAKGLPADDDQALLLCVVE